MLIDLEPGRRMFVDLPLRDPSAWELVTREREFDNTLLGMGGEVVIYIGQTSRRDGWVHTVIVHRTTDEPPLVYKVESHNSDFATTHTERVKTLLATLTA